MKTKNVILGTAAILFAVGGAFASSFLVTAKYAHIPEFPGAQKCRDIADVNCQQETATPCKVTLPGSGFTGQYNVYEDAACTDQVGTNLTTPIPTSLQ